MPTSFRLALAGMAINGAGLLFVLVSAVTCAVWVPAWRKGAIALLGVALLGIGMFVYVWLHA